MTEENFKISEIFVKNWLNNNKDWFKSYSIEHLDLNTIQKWHQKNDSKTNNKKHVENVNSIENHNSKADIFKHDYRNLKRSNSFCNFSLDNKSPNSKTNGLNSNLNQLLKSLNDKNTYFPSEPKQNIIEEVMPNKKQIFKSDHDTLIYFLTEISKETEIKNLSEAIKKNLKILFDFEYASLFFYNFLSKKLISYKYDELFSYYGSKVSNNLYEQEIPSDSYLFKHVLNGDSIYLSAAQLKNETFKLNCNKLESILLIPIKDINQKVIAIVQLTNKLDKKIFDQNDFRLINNFTDFCYGLISKTQIINSLKTENKNLNNLIKSLYDLFKEEKDFDEYFRLVMEKTQKLLNCQNCFVLIKSEYNDKKENSKELSESKKPFDIYQIGDNDCPNNADEILILKDLENNSIDLKTNGTKNNKCKLLIPIIISEGSIIGCAGAFNKINNQAFDSNDEKLFEIFGFFLNLGINNLLNFKKLNHEIVEKNYQIEHFLHHTIFSKNSLNIFLKETPINEYLTIENLKTYTFDDFCLNADEMVYGIYIIFENLNFMDKFKINKKTLFKWLLTIRKNYRDVDFHNWIHAFNVCQNMFAIFSNSLIKNYLTDLEMLALIVGSIVHDLDHPGTNNIFQIESQSNFFKLYGDKSILEKHHFSMFLLILNLPEHNIFENMGLNSYEHLISLIKESVIATDLCEHFKIKNNFTVIANNKNTDWKQEENKNLLRKSLITFCDLASITKPWHLYRKTLNCLSKEFFKQGDIEKYELLLKPIEMMDRNFSKYIPKQQIDWIDKVCLPLYQNFLLICDSFDGHIQRIKQNRFKWFSLKQNS